MSLQRRQIHGMYPSNAVPQSTQMSRPMSTTGVINPVAPIPQYQNILYRVPPGTPPLWNHEGVLSIVNDDTCSPHESLQTRLSRCCDICQVAFEGKTYAVNVGNAVPGQTIQVGIYAFVNFSTTTKNICVADVCFPCIPPSSFAQVSLPVVHPTQASTPVQHNIAISSPWGTNKVSTLG